MQSQLHRYSMIKWYLTIIYSNNYQYLYAVYSESKLQWKSFVFLLIEFAIPFFLNNNNCIIFHIDNIHDSHDCTECSPLDEFHCCHNLEFCYGFVICRMIANICCELMCSNPGGTPEWLGNVIFAVVIAVVSCLTLVYLLSYVHLSGINLYVFFPCIWHCQFCLLS